MANYYEKEPDPARWAYREIDRTAAVLRATQEILEIREKELLDIRGPRGNARCRLHAKHSGPCDC